MEIITKRDTDLLKLIRDVGASLTDLAAWPTSEATKITADNDVKLLKKAFKEAGYPHSFKYFSMMQIASSVYAEAMIRDVKPAALRDVWIKIGEIL